MKKLIVLLLIATLVGILISKCAHAKTDDTLQKMQPILLSQTSTLSILNELLGIDTLCAAVNKTDSSFCIRYGTAYKAHFPCTGISSDTIDRSFFISFQGKNYLTVLTCSERGYHQKYPYVIKFEYSHLTNKAYLLDISKNAPDMPLCIYEEFAKQIEFLEDVLANFNVTELPGVLGEK